MADSTRFEPFRSMPTFAQWDPFGDDVFDLVPTLFRPVARRGAESGMRMDVHDTEDAYRIAVDLPGVRKDDIQVIVNDNQVTIAAEMREEKEAGEQKEQAWLLRERNWGRMTRNLVLPSAVNDAAAEARYVDGVLRLTLPKKEAASRKRLSIH